MEVDVVAIDAAAEPMHNLRGAGGVFGGYVDGVDYGAAVHGAGRIGGMDGAAELQCERAMTGASFEDLDGRGGVSGGGCDVDVEEGDDGGCVKGVDLLLPNGAGVSPIGACEEDERGATYGSYQPADFGNVLFDCGKGHAVLCAGARGHQFSCALPDDVSV